MPWGANMEWPDILETLGRLIQGAGWALSPLLLLPLLTLVFSKSNGIQNLSHGLITLFDAVSFHLGEIIKWALPVLVLSIAFSVFALSIFGLSWTKLFESAEYLHASVIMLGAPATLLAGQHVRVDIFHSRMSPKSRARVDFCGFYILLVPVCLILLWKSQSFVSYAWLIFEGSAESDGIRGEYLLKTLIPLFALFMILQGLAISLRAAMALNDQDRPGRPPHTPAFFAKQELES